MIVQSNIKDTRVKSIREWQKLKKNGEDRKKNQWTGIWNMEQYKLFILNNREKMEKQITRASGTLELYQRN